MIILNQDFKSRGISIDPYDNTSKEQIIYDLRVGSKYQEPGDANTYGIQKVYKLKPGHCILVTTEETLTLPHNVFGQLCSKSSLTALGLFVGNTKIDPNFSGILKVSIFNASNRPLDITQGLRFCSVFFSTIEHSINNNVIRASPEMPSQKKSKLQDFFSTYKSEIITVIITVILSGVTAYAAGYAATKAQLPQTVSIQSTPAESAQIIPLKDSKERQ